MTETNAALKHALPSWRRDEGRGREGKRTAQKSGAQSSPAREQTLREGKESASVLAECVPVSRESSGAAGNLDR